MKARTSGLSSGFKDRGHRGHLEDKLIVLKNRIKSVCYKIGGHRGQMEDKWKYPKTTVEDIKDKCL